MMGQRALTPRQSDVVELLARNWSIARIGAFLGIADSTVRRHITSIHKMRKRGTCALTPRQGDIVELLARDWSTARIGAFLGIADSTVRRHITSIGNKHNIVGRVRLVIWAKSEHRHW